MHKFGFVLLITLLLFANGNDILRQLSGSKKSEKNIFACTKQIYYLCTALADKHQ
jgi:hypothetical protein